MIRLLDPQTIGQIAAGEVIERPFSVVKELVENAVDAGAKRIAVSVEAGGIESIRVSDDGAGIAPEELPLALRRHATSKLSSGSDLQFVDSLGFRGEGLASIAAIANVEIVSRRRDADIAAKICAHGETIGRVGSAPSPPGTIVYVRELFANVPVRREYLRSPASEFSRISAWLSGFALAYPAIAFSLEHNGKDVWVLPADENLEHRLAVVFGKDAARALIPLDAQGASSMHGTLRGFISAPGNDRPDRRMQMLFVNGRMLRSSLLAGAWTAGYSTFAMSGRQPYGVLFLSLPPGHVDANVHPTKSDVRLRYATQMFDAARHAIAATLRSHAAARFARAVAFSPAPQPIDSSLATLQSLFEREGDAPSESAERDGVLRVLAQLDNTFILATDGCALVLVDQHAAHERIAYERIAARAQGSGAGEPMLVPAILEVDSAQSAVLERTVDALREGGLEIEAFGERTYRIVATPAGYGARPFDVNGFLQDLREDPAVRDVRERVWASLACHSVTRAGERLDFSEMHALVEGLQRCQNPMHCPHGRPTIVRMDSVAIQKLFKRL